MKPGTEVKSFMGYHGWVVGKEGDKYRIHFPGNKIYHEGVYPLNELEVIERPLLGKCPKELLR